MLQVLPWYGYDNNNWFGLRVNDLILDRVHLPHLARGL